MKGEKGAITTRVLVLSVAAVVALEAGFLAVMSLVSADGILFFGLIRLLQAAAVIGVAVMLDGDLSAIGLQKHTLFPGLKKGLLWSAGFGFAALVVLGLLYMAGFDVRSIFHTRMPASRADLVLFLMVGGVVGPVAEEVFFRGILYGFFRRWGVILAILVSTGFFLMAHPLRSSFPVTQFVGGVLFAVAYELEGSLMVPILIHVLGNLGIFAVSMAI